MFSQNTSGTNVNFFLERVGNLITLPQEDFATTEQVAHQVHPNSSHQRAVNSFLFNSKI